MNAEQKQKIYEDAKAWVLEAGKRIRDVINEPLEISTKSSHKDLVTHMDKEIEQFLLGKISSTYPDHRVLSEEGFGDEVTSSEGTIWIIDPIDGTMNFVKQKSHFAISVGIVHEGAGEIGIIYNVMDDVLYHVKKGEGAFKNDQRLLPLKKDVHLEDALIELNHFWLCPNRRIDETKLQQLVYKAIGTRAYGSAALELAFVAEGLADAYITLSLQPWDYAAGYILVQEVGGVLTDAAGNSLNFIDRTSVVTANAAIHKEIIDQYIVLK